MRAQHMTGPTGVRVYASCSQGGRKYMEDKYDLKYQLNCDNELQYIYLAIFDGHGGDLAAKYAKDNLCDNIVRQRAFWSKTSDEDVLQAIKKGFVRTHYDMRHEVSNWPKTASGLPSTSGTTASIVFIMNGKYYTGHVGDSRIVLGRRDQSSGNWMSCALTRDHKPESPREKRRIEAAGGQVMNKSGVDRVVWNRPKLGHKGPVRRSTSFDQIPFLAVARSLGDLWSYNSELNTYIVSPEPDVKCIPIDANDSCLVLASDGLWNMMNTQTAVQVIQEVEEDRYSPELLEAVFGTGTTRLSPSRALVHFCLNRWYQSRFRADNTTVLAVMLDDKTGTPLLRTDHSLNQPMSSLFSDSEGEDSDDGYYDSYDTNDYTYGQTYDCLRNNFANNSINTNINHRSGDNRDHTSTATLTTTTSQSSAPQQSNQITSSSTSSSAELSSTTSSSSSSSSSAAAADHNSSLITANEIIDNKPFADHKVLTPLTNVSPNFESIKDNFTDNTNTSLQNTGLSVTTTAAIELPTDADSQSSESSRDSDTTVSPPTPLAITAAEELTDEEYSALPSLVNLSHNEWDLFVVIDPKTLSVHSSDPNTVSNGGVENSCVVQECQSSLANINKVIENTNQCIYGTKSTPYMRQTPNLSDYMLNPNAESFWSESSHFYTSFTSMKGNRSSLPLSYVDNQCSQDLLSNNCSPLLSLKERTTSSAISDNSLCIFGALKTYSSNNNAVNTGSTPVDTTLKKLSKVLANSSNHSSTGKQTAAVSVDSSQKAKTTTRLVFRHKNLLRRLTIETNGGRKTPVLRMSAYKRRHSPDYSPPSKHLRSSLWTRKPLATKEQMSFTRSLKQLAVGRLTRSRLRPMKLLKAFNTNNKKQ